MKLTVFIYFLLPFFWRPLLFLSLVGSGKSTLLDILALRRGDQETLQGSILLNGVESSRSQRNAQTGYQRGIGYVTQDDGELNMDVGLIFYHYSFIVLGGAGS
jgi:ABC-type phosphate/phosphonate transport system ATPase subunit